MKNLQDVSESEKREGTLSNATHIEDGSNSTSRRRFLKTSAVGVAGLGTLGAVGHAAAATGEHTLIIEGIGDRTTTSYSFTVGSNLQKSTAGGARIDENQDWIDGQSGHGAVISETNAYTFDGPLYSFDFRGSDDIQVTLDGEPARVGDRPDHLLVIEGTGPTTSYSFTAGPTLEKSTAYGATADSLDQVIQQSAHGAVGRGKDAYTFDGDLHSFDFDRSGAVQVTLDGLPARVGQRPDHLLLIEGTGSNTPYTFSTSGEVRKSSAYGATIDGSDRLGGTINDRSGRLVSGSVQSGKDAYGFDGTLQTFDFDADGSLRVTIDGKAAHVGNRPDHLLEIEANGERCKYIVETEGGIYEIDGIDPEDEVSERNAIGYVEGSDRDVYAYDGQLYAINADEFSATFRRDGEEFQPDPY